MRIRTAIAALSLASGLALAPAHADTTIEEKRNLEPGGSFFLDAAVGSVKVQGTSSSGAKIVIHSKRDDLRDHYDFKFEESPGTVRVTIKRKDPLTRLRNESIDISVEVPKSTTVDLRTSGGSIDVEDLDRDAKVYTSGGSIEVERLSAKLDAATSGGSIRLVEIGGDTIARTSGGSVDASSIRGKLDVKSSGGPLKLTGITGDIEAETSGGGISIEGAGGRVSAETSGGGIEARFAAGNSRGGKLETSGGGVRVYVDPAVDLTLDASTSGGSVTTGFPVTGTVSSDRQTLRGAIGKGGETLRLRSSGGSIRVEGI